MISWRGSEHLSRRERAARRADRRLAAGAAAVLLTATAIVFMLAPRETSELVVTLYMPADCGSCQRYAEYLRANRFAVVVAGTTVPAPLRAEYRLPRNAQTTPIGFIEGKFVAGHVPAEDIRDLIARPANALGLVVPGTPAGAPGIDSALPSQFTVYRIMPGGLMRAVETYNHPFHFW